MAHAQAARGAQGALYGVFAPVSPPLVRSGRKATALRSIVRVKGDLHSQDLVHSVYYDPMCGASANGSTLNSRRSLADALDPTGTRRQSTMTARGLTNASRDRGLTPAASSAADASRATADCRFGAGGQIGAGAPPTLQVLKSSALGRMYGELPVREH
jgi:hypothetical protein